MRERESERAFSMASSSSSSAVEEFVRKEVPNWDDEVSSTALFKAFSGQRSDWEPRYVFWRDLILKVARHLGVCVVQASEVKNVWFARGVLRPLCIDSVMLEMHKNGDILLRQDLIDPSSGRLYQIIRKVGHFIGITKSSMLQENSEGHLVLRTLLQEKASTVVKLLTESHWTSSCVITMAKFQSMCKASDEASAILSHLVECGKARYLSVRKEELVEGVKVSLVSTSAPSISSLDYDTLHLISTTDQLQQQLDVLDQRWEGSRKSAIASLKSGNKQAAYRHIRQSKLFSDSRTKCASLLDRVEEVLGIISNAESTKKVSEAIQIGARAIKENKVSVEEVHVSLQELEEGVASQKLVEETLEFTPLHSVVIEDEDVEGEFKRLEMEEEFKRLEVELGNESSEVQLASPDGNGALKEASLEVSTEQLSQNLSRLDLEAA